MFLRSKCVDLGQHTGILCEAKVVGNDADVCLRRPHTGRSVIRNTPLDHGCSSMTSWIKPETATIELFQLVSWSTHYSGRIVHTAGLLKSQCKHVIVKCRLYLTGLHVTFKTPFSHSHTHDSHGKERMGIIQVDTIVNIYNRIGWYVLHFVHVRTSPQYDRC